jgi:hypothetical protein
LSDISHFNKMKDQAAMSRLVEAQKKLENALAVLESAAAARSDSSGGDGMAGADRMLQDLQSIDAKVEQAMAIINAAMQKAAPSESGEPQ